MEILTAVLSPLLEYTIKPLMRHVSYPFNWKSKVGDLEENVQALKDAKERLERLVETDRRNRKEIDSDVVEWLKKADEFLVKESAELVQANEQADTKCVFGFFPNLKKQYQVSRKAEKKAADVAKLRRKRDEFSTISHVAPLQGTEALSASDYEVFESRLSVLENVKNALTAVDVSRVGLYGIGGMGKTTLAKEVARKAKEEKLFDQVVFVSVTKEVNIKNIQAQIADMLGLKFDVESVEGRASQLYGRLKQEKSLLLILDDLWEKLDLEAVGIPSKNQHSGCKMLLTSRDRDVLSIQMDCENENNFSIGALAENEAWDLFLKMAGTNLENDDHHSIALEVVKVCAGLPIAIVTTAKTLKIKNSLREWNKALRELKRPQMGNYSKIHSTLKFSYDNLETLQLKSTFLLCSQMGYNATIRDLLKFGIGLGLFQNDFTLEEVQDTTFCLVNRLKASCLLMEGSETEEIVMHDVVRETGRLIASSDHGVLIIDDENMRKVLVDEDRMKATTAIWVHGNVNELPHKIQCPELVLFHANVKGFYYLEVPDKLFEGLNKLKVLSLKSGLSLSFLPSSLVLLENLKTLCFHGLSELGDVSIIGELKTLEVLSFVNCEALKLPKEIGQLTGLKMLDLSNCYTLHIAPKVLSRLSRLEELYISRSCHSWDIEGPDAASPIELQELKSLTTLEIIIPNFRVSEEIFSNKLCRYKISIGSSWSHIEYFSSNYKMSKTLRLNLEYGSINDMGNRVMELIKETEELCLIYLKGVKNFGYELDRDGFPKLKHLHLYDCPDIQHIVETMEVAPPVALPMLESLELQSLISLVSLERICHCRDTTQSFFSRLRIIKVGDCNKLTYLFSLFVFTTSRN